MRLTQLCAALAVLMVFGNVPALAGSRLLAVTWNEREGDWVGVWSPKDAHAADGQYSALWRKGSETEAADLTITLGPFSLGGVDVQIVRLSRRGDGRCDYTGRLRPETPGVARYWHVTGTYSCARGPLLRWSARLDAGPGPVGDDGTVASEFSLLGDLRLSKRWREQEGDWSGNWVPRHPARRDGVYDARWHKGNNEWASAFLQITVARDGRSVQVRRTEPKGTCTYNGTFADTGPAAREVAGTYTCSWDYPRRRLPWNATVDE